MEQTLEQVLGYIHNYFIHEVYKGDYTITSGSLDVDFLQSGQYFRIVGSVFNDGVYKYPVDDLSDETFTGEIWSLAVPKLLLSIVDDIDAWNIKYKESTESPYSSESFGGYSRTKANGGSSSGGGAITWQDVFGNKLNQWRKIS